MLKAVMETSSCLAVSSSPNASFKLLLSNGSWIELAKPALMGVINVSPNSFYRSYDDINSMLLQVEHMLAAGAVIIDVGGEATNPQVDLAQDGPNIEQEIARVIPAVTAIKKQFNVLVSVDTSRPAVMAAAIAAGADMINDQRSLSMPGALDIVAKEAVPVCLMHFFKQGRQAGSSSAAQLLQTIKDDLLLSIQQCVSAGIADGRIIIDPGFGQGHFGKNCQENFYLLKHLTSLTEWSYPVLSAWSRKSMIGEALGDVAPSARLYGSIAADTIATLNGAAIIRSHDIAATQDAIRVARYYLAA